MAEFKLLWQRANAWNVSFKTPYSNQITLPTQLIILNYIVILSHWHGTTVPIDTYPLWQNLIRSCVCNVAILACKVNVQKITCVCTCHTQQTGPDVNLGYYYVTGIITGRSRVGEDIAEKIVNLFAFAVERPSNLCRNCTFSNTSFTGKD